MAFVENIGHWPTVHFWAFSGFALGFTGVGFYTGFHGMRRTRLVQDVPTARVRSAPQGYVELEGIARLLDETPELAPLSGKPCCWYKFSIERRSKDKWVRVKSGHSDRQFLLEDVTGECVIDPHGAEVSTRHKRTWSGDSGEALWLGIQRSSFSEWFGGRYRYTEELLVDGDPLYAVGWFKSLDDLDHRRGRDALTRDLLREWKQRQVTLIERFDHDRNGRIDPEEWEMVRSAAERRADEDYAEQRTAMHVHRLSRPDDRQLPFLLANLPQEDLVQRYRWRTWGGFGLFFIAGSVATWLLAARFF
jgi:hypothetical protein